VVTVVAAAQQQQQKQQQWVRLLQQWQWQLLQQWHTQLGDVAGCRPAGPRLTWCGLNSAPGSGVGLRQYLTRPCTDVSPLPCVGRPGGLMMIAMWSSS
jgi:hypothetical protein